MDNTCLGNSGIGRRQYLVTYSQADLVKFPTRNSFGSMLKAAFDRGESKVKTQYWACCQEKHANGGYHYHCSLKLTGVKKWDMVKQTILKDHGIVVNFSASHNFYVSAYRYVTKEDTEVHHSPGHPDLSNATSPRTKTCTLAYLKKKRTQKSAEGSKHGANAASAKKRLKLCNLDVSELVVKHNIKSTLALFHLGEQRKQAGEFDLATYLLARTVKQTEEIISKAWLLKSAGSKMVRENTSRMQMIEGASRGNCCVENCHWLQYAIEVLRLNRIEVRKFATYLRESLTLGRGKYRNLMLVGESNCAKTFMLRPLKRIFGDRLYENPAHDKYCWVGAESADVILLQDFRYSRDIIPWSSLLLLLEGETVKLPAPKNHHESDVVIDTDIAIFATSKSKIEYRGPFNLGDEKEQGMMDSRWRVIKFTHVFSQADQKDIKPCEKCFSELVLLGDSC